MTRRLGHVLALMTIVLGASAVSATAVDPTKESLLSAWEASQRADPQTVRFEPIGDRRYRFATDRFPFDGVVRVLNLVVDDRQIEAMNGFTLGMVEAKLEDASSGFLADHAMSVSLWQAGNSFYFDSDAGRWLDAAEWQRRWAHQVPSRSVMSWLSGNLFWVVFLVVLAVLLSLLTRKANRQMKAAMAAQDRALAEQERAIRMSQEMLDVARDSNRLLRELLELLRGRGPSEP